MIVPIGVATPTLKLNTMEAGGGQLAVLPALTLECYLPIEGTAQLVRVDIPAGTRVIGSMAWDGVLSFPELRETPSVAVDGAVSAVIKVGFPGGELRFNQAVRILIPGQAVNL